MPDARPTTITLTQQIAPSRRMPPGHVFFVDPSALDRVRQWANVAALAEGDDEFAANEAMSEIESDEEIFKREWAEMIGLYRIAASDSPMASEGAIALNAKLHAHRLNTSYTVLATLPPAKVIDALAPKYLLTPAAMPSGPFGPSVMAESAEALVETMERLRRDPRIASQLSSAGYLTTSTLR